MSKILKVISLLLLLSGCASNSYLDEGDDISRDGPEFQWPVYGASLTQKFRPKRAPYRRAHRGIDLASGKDAPIYAIDHGIVTYAGAGKTGYGRLVVISHMNKEFKSYYAHLSRFKVNKGDVVRKGDLIGLMGRSGRATGVHLHFEVRRENDPIDPLDVLPPMSAVSQQASPNP